MTDRANIEVVDSSLVSRTTRESLAGATLVERTLGGRVFTMAGGETMQTAPHVNMEHGGMVLSGPTALQTAWRLRARHQDLVFLIEPTSVLAPATAERPLIIDEPVDALIAPTVEETLQAQRDAGAAVAVIPAGFVDVADPGALKAVLAAADNIDRDDVILPLAVHQKWSTPDHISQLIAVAARSRHPVALALGAKTGDPLNLKGAPESYRRFFGEVKGAVPWRADFAGIDAFASGARAAVIGQIPSLRRLPVPGSRPYSSRPGDRTPHVLMPELMRFARSSEMHLKWFASATPWPCPCRHCEGRAVDSFTGSDEDRLRAHLHNLAALDEIAGIVTSMGTSQVARWWNQRLAEAEAEHVRLAQHTGVMISMPPTLARWRSLS